MIERDAGSQVDRAGDAALDQVGRLVLEHVNAGEEFGWDVGEPEGATVVGREGVATVELGTDEGEAAHDDAAAFDGEVVRVHTGGEAVDRDTRDALKGFGDGTVGKGTDVLGADRINEDFGVTLDGLGALQASTDAGDHHLLDLGIVGIVLGRSGLGPGGGTVDGGGDSERGGPVTRPMAVVGPTGRSCGGGLMHLFSPQVL